VFLWSVAAADDLAWMSSTPEGDPIDYLPVAPGNTYTLWSFIYNESAPASSYHFPIGYSAGALEILDFDVVFDTILIFPWWCFETYDWFSFHDSINSYITWFVWTSTYPTCDFPAGGQIRVGYVEFQYLSNNVSEIVEGIGPTGMPIHYTNASTMIDYFPTFIPVILDPEVNVKEAGTGNSFKINSLSQPEPNPFRASTAIRFGLMETQKVVLSIYDATGRSVRVLVDETRDAGHYNMTWNGRDDTGRRLSAGVYFVKLTTETFKSARKVILR
jgi:hypothetical protein